MSVSGMRLIGTVEAAQVEHVLERLVLLLSPGGLAAFLGVEIGPYITKRAKGRFRDEGDDVVGRWAQLSDATVAWRVSQNFPGEHPINHRTGALENWVVGSGWDAYPTGTGASMKFPGKQPTGLTRKKAMTAQAGDSQSNTPPRPVIGVNEKDLLFFQTALLTEIEKVMM